MQKQHSASLAHVSMVTVTVSSCETPSSLNIRFEISVKIQIGVPFSDKVTTGLLSTIPSI